MERRVGYRLEVEKVEGGGRYGSVWDGWVVCNRRRLTAVGTACGVSTHDSQTKSAHTQILEDPLSVSCSI